jgi:hypothetical protein
LNNQHFPPFGPATTEYAEFLQRGNEGIWQDRFNIWQKTTGNIPPGFV